MSDSFLRTTKVPDYLDMLYEFRDVLADYRSQHIDCSGFLEQFNLNFNVLKFIIERGYQEQLPLIFKILYEKERIKPKIVSEKKFYQERKTLFSSRFCLYLEKFKVAGRDNLKDFLDSKTNNKSSIERDDNTTQLFYFRKFLIFSTFFCTAFNYNFKINDDQEVIVESSKQQNSTLQRESKNYYLFYNRSHIDKMDVGIGEVKISGDSNVEVEYFYLESDEPKQRKTSELKNVKKTKLVSIKTKGKVKKYKSRSILVLKDLIDAKLTPEQLEDGQGVESNYVLKQIDEDKEKILLGINNSWNRDSDFPYATAVLLIDQTTYDLEHRPNTKYAFDNVKKTRKIPPNLHYYLYDQSVSLESVINSRYNTQLRIWYPLIKPKEDIPFFLEEAQYLRYLSGKYKGLTIVRSGTIQELVLSRLEIEETGLVNLTVTNEQNEIITFSNNFDKGFVKNIEVDNNGQGKVFINLRYYFSEHYNALNYYLSFEHLTEKGKTSKPFYLKGGYAGESLVSNNLIGASIIFQEIRNDDPFQVSRYELHSLYSQTFLNLYIANTNLFEFYLSSDTDLFTNQAGISLLREKFEIAESEKSGVLLETDYDVYISVPMTIHRSQEEYLRNRDIADKLISELTSRFNFDRRRIFCACMHNGKFFSYDEYCKHFKGGPKIYNYMQVVLKKTKIHIHLRPKSLNATPTARISSSIVEVAYAYGVGNRIIIICDEEEKDNLPDNIVKLNEANTFTFSTNNTDAFKILFDSFIDGTTLRDLLTRKEYK